MEKDELLNDCSLEEEIEETEEEAQEEKQTASPEPTFKEIVIKECKRIIAKYKEIMSTQNDIAFQNGINDPNKSEDECVNHIMNCLVSKRIYGGDDELMYEYIHEYYVDSIKAEDGWSDRINNNAGRGKPKAELTEEQKKKLIEKAEADFLEKQRVKLEEQEKKRLEKEKAKEKARIQKEQEAKAKAKEEAKSSGGATQMSIFDF